MLLKWSITNINMNSILKHNQLLNLLLITKKKIVKIRLKMHTSFVTVRFIESYLPRL